MKIKRPSFQFYTREWLGSIDVRALTLAERGALVDAACRGALVGSFTPFLRLEQRPYIPRAVRREVLARDQHRCRGCGASGPLEMDHVVAWCRGGATDPDNLQALCKPCNLQKGAQ